LAGGPQSTFAGTTDPVPMTDGDDDGDGPGTTDPVPTTESDDGDGPGAEDVALARQQLFVGSGVAALSGVAVVVAGTQQFPGLPFVAILAAGAATTGLLFALLSASLFRGTD
jgi:hypothetical protein